MFVFFREFFVLLSFINFAVRGMKTRQQGELVVQTFNVAVCKEIVPFVVFNKPRNVRGEGGQVFDISVYAAALPQLFQLDCRHKLAHFCVVIVCINAVWRAEQVGQRTSNYYLSE